MLGDRPVLTDQPLENIFQYVPFANVMRTWCFAELLGKEPVLRGQHERLREEFVLVRMPIALACLARALQVLHQQVPAGSLQLFNGCRDSVGSSIYFPLLFLLLRKNCLKKCPNSGECATQCGENFGAAYSVQRASKGVLAGELDVAGEVIEPLVLLQPRVVEPRVGGERVYVRPAASALLIIMLQGSRQCQVPQALTFRDLARCPYQATVSSHSHQIFSTAQP